MLEIKTVVSRHNPDVYRFDITGKTNGIEVECQTLTYFPVLFGTFVDGLIPERKVHRKEGGHVSYTIVRNVRFALKEYVEMHFTEQYGEYTV